MILTIALAATIFALVWVLDRQGKRHHEVEQANRLERAGLMQRIQAPELAVIEHNQAQAQAPSVTHALSDEQAAQDEERARVIAEMERAENEMLEARQF